MRSSKGDDGLWRPGADSPARGAAEGGFPQIKTDIDGQARRASLDVGSDQVSADSVTHRPLLPHDVGPDWMAERD